MPIFEVSSETSTLLQFQRVTPGSGELFESEIEELVWNNSEEMLGDSLLPVARQASISGGGIPDIVALDTDGSVVIIEVKRDVDRRQLAQCLEYAGWARTTNLDGLAGIYHRGHEKFFEDWMQFTDSESPKLVASDPRLVLVAHEFEGRTKDALDFLKANGVPVRLVTVAIYADEGKRRFLEVGGEVEAQAAPSAGSVSSAPEGPRPDLAELAQNGLISPGDQLVWKRPRLGVEYHAAITSDLGIEISDGRRFLTPSGAAKAAAEIPAYNGWKAWVLVKTGERLEELQSQLG